MKMVDDGDQVLAGDRGAEKRGLLARIVKWVMVIKRTREME